MKLPQPAGPLSTALIEYLRTGEEPPEADPRVGGPGALNDRDLQLALYAAYELHYRGYEDAQADHEWDPAVIAFRARLEEAFSAAVDAATPPGSSAEPGEVGGRLFELARADASPSLAKRLSDKGTVEQIREFVIHRSAYQLKEADPHSWAIPRLEGKAKAALLEVQFDEYGSGHADRIHARLFAQAMETLQLDSSYGAYIDRLPAETLATVNLMSMLGLHRRMRGAIVGHLAMFEITSAGPNRLYARALRRLGIPEATDFFDEHVEADSVHENIAAYDLAQSLAVAEPALTSDILFGARALLALDGLWAAKVLSDWDARHSSLLTAPARVVA